MKTQLFKKTFLHLIAIVFVAFLVFPLVMLIFNSFKTQEEIVMSPIGFPVKGTIDNYCEVFKSSSFAINLRNSFIVASITVLVTIVVAAPAGYALSRFRFRGRTAFSMWLLATQAFPGILMVLGLFTVFKLYGLLNNLLGLIILHTSFSMPFSVWLLKGYFDTIPIDLEEAALIDGCNRVRALAKVILPLSVPGLLGVGTFSLLLSWNEFFFALVIMRDNAHYTLPVFLARFLGTGGVVRWGPLSAAALIATIPVLIAFMLGQRYLVSGLTGGAIK